MSRRAQASLGRMAYLLRGTNEAGDPVEVVVEPCWRCGGLIDVMFMSMVDHVDQVHPPRASSAPTEPRHALRTERRPASE